MLKNNYKKDFLKKKIGELSQEMKIGILAWVILDNHYHLMFMINNPIISGMTDASLSCRTYDTLASVIPSSAVPSSAHQEKLARFVKRLHSITSKEFNKMDNASGRKVWYQYWDYCIRNQADFWRHFNYIVQNPLKHGLTKSLYEAFEYPYSSNLVWLKRFGKDGVWESFVHYPVKDWTPIY